MSNTTIEEAFYRHVFFEPNSGCWLWTGPTNGRHYGRVYAVRLTGCRVMYAHHFALMVERKQSIPTGAVVMHSCDNTYCVNPDHLRIATQFDNVADRQSKNRQARGSKIWGSKLTQTDVLHIRQKLMPQAEYATLYGVHRAHISKIQSGKKWGYV